MAKMTWREKSYCRRRLNCVRHITLDPRGPGVVRIHMIPPRTEDPADPFLLLLNGARLLPLNLSWAILLANFMDQLEPCSGQEIGEEDWQHILEQTVKNTRATYPRTRTALLLSDLQRMLRAIVAIARGQEPEEEIGLMTLGEYAGKMSAPHRMDLMLSAMTREGQWHCNQKCLHCYAAGQSLADRPELGTAEWKALLEKLRRANIPQVTFTGGEPTLRADLVELVEAAQWFVTRLNTNGRLLTPQLCRRLFEASLDSVQVTLYAADADTHNTLVGAPGWEDTAAGIRNAAEAGLIVSVNTPLCSLNRDYAETLRFARSLGVRYATCSGLIPTGSAQGEESRATRLTEAELTEILTEAVDVARELGMELDFTSPGWLPEQTLRRLGLTLIPSCGACLSNMALAPDGTVLPCQSWLEGNGLGNLLRDPWADIWDGETCRRIRAGSAKMEHICQLQREGGR